MAGLKTKSVPSVERALTIFEMLAASEKGLTLSDVARNLELPRSSTHYIMLTLQRRGYVLRNGERGRYRFTSRFFSLANTTLSGLSLRVQSRPYLRALMEKTGLTVHMALLEQNELVIIEKIEPPVPFQLATWVGKRMAMHCTGAGKALLAYVPEPILDQVIRHGLIRYNDNTIVSPRKLKEELAQVRKRGYAVDDEEETIGLRCVGAPVLGATESAVATISIAGTTDQITPENLTPMAEVLTQTACALSQHLVYDAEPPHLGPEANSRHDKT
jgi:DNA-binding IclR family transcriptional regulator